MNKFYVLIFSVIKICFCWESSKILVPNYSQIIDSNLYNGLDVLELSDFKILENKTIGIVVNHTSKNRYNFNIIDILNEKKNIYLKKIFTPEHGLKGNISAGEFINSEFDYKNDIEIISLYGKNKRPDKEDLVDLDLILYDIQDIGSRYYTYISTMSYMMQSCGESNIPFILLDRANPLGGDYIRGPILDSDFSSFVGLHPIPIVHGMTSGELAIMINELNWINSRVDLTIIPILNWKRKNQNIFASNKWIHPSPNIPDLETAKLYTGLCLLEGTNISEGRGTYTPFKSIGAPFLNLEKVLNSINKIQNRGIDYSQIDFTPISIIGMSKWPKFENKKCHGIKLSINNNYDALRFTVELLSIIYNTHPNQFKFLNSNFIDKLYGSDKLRKTIINSGDLNILFKDWDLDEKKFTKKRAKFLIYN